MHLQAGIFPVHTQDVPRVVAVWAASVRATHHFVSDADIQSFKPLVRDALAHLPALVCVRDRHDQVAGFIGVAHGKVEMLFLHPAVRGQGAGRRLLTYAVETLGATTLDVNEQNAQAVGFYRHMGFVVVGRSERDALGKPYPLLHLQRATPASA